MTPEAVRQRLAEWLSGVVPLWLLPRGLPGWPVALGLGLVVALLVGSTLGPRLGIARARLVLWLASLLMVPAFTWTVPNTADRWPDVWEMCSKGYLPRPSMLVSGVPHEVVVNVLLLIPAGAVVLWPVGMQRLSALGVALAISPVIELVQLTPAMHRRCQAGDVVNNSLGVVVGFALATAVESVWRSVMLMRAAADPSLPQSGGAPPPGSRSPADGVRIRGRDG